MTRLIELCCGCGALSLSLLGHRPVMPYMGSKLRYADAITSRCRIPTPDEVVLVDVGPWPRVLELLSTDAAARIEVASILDRFCEADPRELFSHLVSSEVVPFDDWPAYHVAAFLTLQRWSYRAKPVRIVAGRWRHPGFSQSDAYGVQESATFGEVKPQLPTTARRVRAWPDLPVRGICEDVRTVSLSRFIDGETWVYMDPPYAGTTGYTRNDMRRSDVLDVARRCRAAGARVVVSEAAPLPLAGWDVVEITTQRKVRRSSAQTREWLTASPEVGLVGSRVPRRRPLDTRQGSLWGAA